MKTARFCLLGGLLCLILGPIASTRVYPARYPITGLELDEDIRCRLVGFDKLD